VSRRLIAVLEAVWTVLYGLLWAVGIVAPVPVTAIIFVVVLCILQIGGPNARH